MRNMQTIPSISFHRPHEADNSQSSCDLTFVSPCCRRSGSVKTNIEEGGGKKNQQHQHFIREQ
jgi:hypothetical protein